MGKNSNDNDDRRSLTDAGIFLFMGGVNEERCASAIRFVISHNIQEKKVKEIKLVVSSVGGQLDCAFALIDTIKGSAIPVSTVGIGCIASAGLLIFISGDEGRRILTPNTSILSHQFSWGSAGKEHELFAAIKEFELTTERMVKHYMKCTGLSKSDVRKYLLPPEDRWLSAKESRKLGVCDVIKTVY
jgi:ATP-dependent Clp protease, protease subunit